MSSEPAFVRPSLDNDNSLCLKCGEHRTIVYWRTWVAKKARWFGSCDRDCPEGEHLHCGERCRRCSAEIEWAEPVGDAS